VKIPHAPARTHHTADHPGEVDDAESGGERSEAAQRPAPTDDDGILAPLFQAPPRARGLPPHELVEHARVVRVLAFDVDGVCTDGRLFYGPDGCALHAFHARDGLAIVKARESGLVLAAISGRASKNVAARLGELKVPHIRQGVARKSVELDGLLQELGVPWVACCYVGDDVNDVGCLRRAGLAVAPADGAFDAVAAAHYVTRRRGGDGVLREIVELVLRAQGRWSIDDV
jgi:3-deoxy-D-manno-octulosonate 8-phosphate phosphatase (KDO 8-P phosphatase)